MNAPQNPAAGSPASGPVLMKRATYAAVAVALALVLMKAGAFWLTGSVAMLGTLLDSLLDGTASLVNLFAVRFALEPADRDHRFGHGKAEALAGLGQSVFIFISAGYITYESASRLIAPEPLSRSLIGIAVTVVAIALTLALVAYQRKVVRETNSLAIEADSIHYRGDLLMNLSVIAALLLSGVFGLTWADPIFGFVIAGFIAWSALQIVRNAGDQLMDKEMSEEDRDRIKQVVAAHEEAIDMHDLRTRMSGANLFIQFHLELDGSLSLMKAHRITDDIEKEIEALFPGSEVLIHQDPAGLERVPKLLRT
ncbi:cation diffusion facilitator family transporter [Tepidicaulis marinus]|uniref:Cation-efflux pump FieF n=1 Tax=Tepidicaulis marinus TaxID=1333998 RepID=A0A081BDL5_9HYPH|nr:cation diffusion facilitator family transporter [Tepidicaulis marinus]GAK46133.1 cation diffusion facilitator family transporter [Tepidicaulis marinus]